MKILVIANPASGSGKAAARIPAAEAALRNAGLQFDLVRTERPWHAAELAAQAAREGCDLVITAGGDGTANEALNGLLQARAEGCAATALSILRIGTGNDFAASLGLPADLDEAARAIQSGRRQWIDVGLLKGGDHPEGRYFGNAAGVGFDAAGTIQAKKITWARGALVYLISVLQTILIYYKAPTLRITDDHGEITIPALMVSIMNGRRIGGQFMLAPDGKFDDGLLDLCVAEEVSRLRMFGLISHFIKGTQGSQPEIHMSRTRRGHITAVKGGMPAHIDGEIIAEDAQEMEITILPAQIQIAGIG